MRDQEQVIPETPNPLAPSEAGSSPTATPRWPGPRKSTVNAKRRDFELFLRDFAETMWSEDVDDWTRSVTLGFQNRLEHEANGGGNLCHDLGQPGDGDPPPVCPLDDDGNNRQAVVGPQPGGGEQDVIDPTAGLR